MKMKILKSHQSQQQLLLYNNDTSRQGGLPLLAACSPTRFNCSEFASSLFKLRLRRWRCRLDLRQWWWRWQLVSGIH